MRKMPSLAGWALATLALCVGCSTTSELSQAEAWELSAELEDEPAGAAPLPEREDAEAAPPDADGSLLGEPVEIIVAGLDGLASSAAWAEGDGAAADDDDEASDPLHFAPLFHRWYWRGHPYELPLPGGGVLPIEPHEYDEVNRAAQEPWNPYRQNTLKGDFPLPGTKDLFLNVSVSERFIAQTRRVPTPTNNVGLGPIKPDFWGDSRQEAFTNDIAVSFDLFKGQQNFKPVEWRLRITPVFNVNVLDVREKGITNVDVTRSTHRVRRDLALQEALFEYHLHDWNRRYDFLSVEVGIFPFRSDFRGFIFDDVNLGIRFVSNADNNKWQYNLAFFDMLNKETNSLLNEFENREQSVLVANVYRQDWPWLGYISSFSFHANHDRRGEHFDENGFPISPYPQGSNEVGDLDAYYLGWAGEGHIGRVNVSHAFYQVVGHQDANFLAARDVTINAQFAALELSYDVDWWRFRVYGMYASGDSDAADSRGEGFDAIMDAPNFAGGEFSYFNSQAIASGTNGLLLTSPLSHLPDLQRSKFEGQANFVNPGLALTGAAINADLTPRSRAIVGTNYMLFDDTDALERFFQPVTSTIDNQIGLEFYSQFQYRPLLTNNVIFNLGASALVPGDGFERIYQDDETLYTVFLQVLLNY